MKRRRGSRKLQGTNCLPLVWIMWCPHFLVTALDLNSHLYLYNLFFFVLGAAPCGTPTQPYPHYSMHFYSISANDRKKIKCRSNGGYFCLPATEQCSESGNRFYLDGVGLERCDDNITYANVPSGFAWTIDGNPAIRINAGSPGMDFMDWFPLTWLEVMRHPFFYWFSMTQLLLQITLSFGEDFRLVKIILAMTTIGHKTIHTTAKTLPSTQVSLLRLLLIAWLWRVEPTWPSQDQLPNARSPSLRNGIALIHLPSQARMQRRLSLIKRA